MGNASTKTWRCVLCGYVHRGGEAPKECPVCGAGAADFEPHNAPADSPTPNAPAPADAPAPAAEPQPARRRIIVLGAGVAGVSAAKAAAHADADAEVVLIAKEDHIPYYRLNLTKFLAGEIGDQELPIHPEKWYAEHRIHLRLGVEVAALRAEEHRIELRGGAAEPFTRLIVATGSHAVVPPIPGAHKQGVIALRTVADAREVLAELRPAVHVACIGGGLQGLETAAALAKRGAEVTVLENAPWLMPRQLTEDASRLLTQRVQAKGIYVRTAAAVKEIVGDERAAGVLLQDGTVVAADMVILAAGVRPNSYLARRAGLRVNFGVVVDDRLVSSHPDILAAGDVAEHRGVLYGTWGPAMYQGSIAGMNAAGGAVEFGGVPRSSALKVLGLTLMSIGDFAGEGGLVVQEDGEARHLRFVFRDGRMVGAILMGEVTIVAQVKKAIEGKTDLSALVASDPSAADVYDFMKKPTKAS